MADRYWMDARNAALVRLAGVLSKQIGEAVGWRDLLYDEPLRSWVYPVRGVWNKDEAKGRWMSRCLRLHIYDTRRGCWYGSEIKETLERYALEGGELDADRTGGYEAARDDPPGQVHSDDASAASEAVDPGSERWADLLWR